MKKFVLNIFVWAVNALLIASSAFLTSSCAPEVLPVVPEEPQQEQMATEHLFFAAAMIDEETKVDFEYNSKLRMTWHGDEVLHVYIKRQNGTIEQPEAGIVEAVSGSLCENNRSLSFEGDVRARTNPETDKFIFMYAELGSVVVGGTQKLVYNYDFTKQTIDASDEGLGSLRTCFPIIFEENDVAVMKAERKACVVKLAATGLPANAKVTSVNFYSASEIFPKVVDVTGFNFATTNLSHTLSYAIENASTDNSGAVTLYLAAPLVQGEKEYTITVVCEKDGEYVSKKAQTGITGTSALSVSKLYNLRRGEWDGGVNPGTVVGNPGDKMESIVGQWDKTGYLSNDVYGVLEKGKPQYLSLMHNAIINATQKAYRKSSVSNRDLFIHPAAVRAAGKQGQPEETGQTLATNGPQYVEVTGTYSTAEDLTFNNIRLKKATKLYMTFVDSKAYNTNTVGYYCYPTSAEIEYAGKVGHDKIHEMVVFPSTSQDLTDPTVTHKFDAKTTAELLYPEYDKESKLTGVLTQTFAAGTTVGFFGYTNGLDNTKDFAIKPLTSDPTAGGVHYTNIAWNRRNVFDPQPYWNQISVLRVIMSGESEPRTDCVILAMKDKYVAHSVGGAATWTNPIILIYASDPDAIDFETSKGFWTSTVDLNDVQFGISYDLDAVTSTNTANVFDSSTGYTTTLAVANSEFGGFSTLQITAGGVDITDRAVKYNNGEKTSATVTITKDDAAGDIVIKAHAAKNIMVQSLTAADLMSLAEQTGDLPTFRLILHCTTASSGVVAFGMDKSGSYCRPNSMCPFANKIYQEPTRVKVEDQYNDYEWSLEKAVDGSGNFIGFKLKKVTKISETQMQLDGYIKRASVGTTYAILEDTGTILTAEQIESGYQMYIKSGDSSYQYLTCAFGSNLKNAVFWSFSDHVEKLYGKWTVYKVWLEDRQ